MEKKSTKQYVVVLYMLLVKMNLKWTYLYQCFQTAPHHSPSYLSPLPHKHTPPRVARILWERLVVQGSSCYQLQNCDCFGEGFPSWCFQVVLAGSGDVCKNHLHEHSQGEVHQYRRIWSMCSSRLALSMSFMECEMCLSHLSQLSFTDLDTT